jgi:hypothetical protein
MNTYNIYRNGKLAIKNVSAETISATTGIHARNIHRYMQPDKQYTGKDKAKYYFDKNIKERKEYKPRSQEDIIEGKMQLPKSIIDDWNNMMEAARLIRTGKGRITGKLVNGKWRLYTERKQKG